MLFDPYADYLTPPLQGFRLHKGDYVPMPLVVGRIVSEVLGLHLEAHGEDLRLYDPATGGWLRTPPEVRKFIAETTAEIERIEAGIKRMQAGRDRAMAETARLEQELDELRRQLGETRD
ncbi:MAG TPA: hypothetical protein VND64_15085 [Pirellulales bacterium]|nr:hypothetical protein [Pirellulales bacterium]